MFNVTSLLRMVSQHGQSLTLSQQSGVSYDPVTGGTTSTETTEDFVGYFFNDTQGIFQGNSIERGSRALLIPSFNITSTPSIGDKVEGQRDSVEITSVSHIYSGSNPVCYVLGVSE